MTLPKTFCILPWKSMEVTPMGTYRPCCLYSETIPDLSIQQGHTISDAQNSEYMQDLRSSFLRGEKPAGCDTCWQEESVPGRMSKRRFSAIKIQSDDPQVVEAKFLDLKLGNICNLKCRICGSWSSSKWAQEEIETGRDTERTRANHAGGQWPRKTPNWQEALEDSLDKIEYLEISGGEPFLINEHFDLLQQLVDKGFASKIDIHYNTNGTIWPDRGPNIWKHFKRVEIAFSIDDTGERFEYQRHGSNWKETEEVIRRAVQFRYDSFRNGKKNIALQICTTFNIQNAYHWPETEDWIIKQGIRDVHYNLMHDPAMFNLRNMPADIKHVYAQRMLSCTDFSKSRIQEVVNFMQMPGENMLPQLRERLARNDAYRKEKFSDSHPNIWSLIDGR